MNDRAEPRTTAIRRGRMKRLEGQRYRGPAIVHWSMTIAARQSGWLTSALHDRFREIQLHTLARYQLLCPVYCLMPDHLHLLWAGLAPASDQARAVTWFRRYLNLALRQCEVQLQKQPWDVVLRDRDLEHDAVERLLFYIAANPVRAGLVDRASVWPYSGALVVGYPDLNLWGDGFRARLWSIYEREVLRVARDAPGAEPERNRDRFRSGAKQGATASAERNP